MNLNTKFGQNWIDLKFWDFWKCVWVPPTLTALEALQFGHAIDLILRKIVIADSFLGLVQLMKIDLSNKFYRINLNINAIPKLAVIFPTKPGEPPLVAFLLVVPMGQKNNLSIFSTTTTQTMANLVNHRLRTNTAYPHIPCSASHSIAASQSTIEWRSLGSPSSPDPFHSTLSVASIETASPWITLVPCPVVEELATLRTGANLV